MSLKIAQPAGIGHTVDIFIQCGSSLSEGIGSLEFCVPGTNRIATATRSPATGKVALSTDENTQAEHSAHRSLYYNHAKQRGSSRRGSNHRMIPMDTNVRLLTSIEWTPCCRVEIDNQLRAREISVSEPSCRVVKAASRSICEPLI